MSKEIEAATEWSQEYDSAVIGFFEFFPMTGNYAVWGAKLNNDSIFPIEILRWLEGICCQFPWCYVLLLKPFSTPQGLTAILFWVPN